MVLHTALAAARGHELSILALGRRCFSVSAVAHLNSPPSSTSSTSPATTATSASSAAPSTTATTTTATASPATKRKVVVLGTGWAGFRFIRDVDSALFDVTVVSQRDHMVFTPLLVSTAVGTLEHRSIIEPARPLIARKNMSLVIAEATKVDTEKRVVMAKPLLHPPAATSIANENPTDIPLPYDHLVVAVGALPNTFGIPGVEKHAMFMKEVSDARAVRSRILACFETAMYPGMGLQEQKNLLTFVVVGGGPTGVELVSELSDFISEDISVDYPILAPLVSVVLVEASGNVLSSFDQTLRDYALQRLRAARTQVRLSASVQAVHPDRVVLSTGEQLPCGLVVWSTGVGPRAFVRSSGLATDAKGLRLQTDGMCRVGNSQPGTVFAIGDCATSGGGPPLPAIAQVAEQEGRWLAAQLNAQARGEAAFQAPFDFHSKGMLAYVGQWRGLADVVAKDREKQSPLSVRIKGMAAFLVWRGVYLTKLGSWRNRLQVPFDWLKTLLFGRDISQL